jgi:hypothetical protein
MSAFDDLVFHEAYELADQLLPVFEIADHLAWQFT